MKVYIGFDPREMRAYRICKASLSAYSGDLEMHPIYAIGEPEYNRPEIMRNGVRWDVISDAPMSTDFSIARFWVPRKAQRGWVLYCDCDFLFRANVDELFALASPSYAVMVVKHQYEAKENIKMDGQIQTQYARKNWSSLVLWNCDHPANDAIKSLNWLNVRPGRDMHQFKWLEDKEIGELPREWNYLAGVSEPCEPKAVHFTLGTPDMRGHENSPYADEWWAMEETHGCISR